MLSSYPLSFPYYISFPLSLTIPHYLPSFPFYSQFLLLSVFNPVSSSFVLLFPNFYPLYLFPLPCPFLSPIFFSFSFSFTSSFLPLPQYHLSFPFHPHSPLSLSIPLNPPLSFLFYFSFISPFLLLFLNTTPRPSPLFPSPHIIQSFPSHSARSTPTPPHLLPPEG